MTRKLRAGARDAGVEGLMIKRKDSAYLAGRPTGPWFKLKRDPLTADCVLMYAQRGHGKRSSFYSDYTFGVWREAALVPVGKAYFGFTDEELALTYPPGYSGDPDAEVERRPGTDTAKG